MVDQAIVWALIIGVVAWQCLRQAHVALLRAGARERLRPDAAATTALGSHIGQLLSQPGTAPELATYGAMTAAEYVWSWSMIDPDVIRAADFSANAAIHNGYDFAQFIHVHYDSLGTAAKEGFFNRLMGYVGEQQVAHILEAQGHIVQVAETANQPVWDLLIDGHAANVKTVASIASFKAEALAHPDVTYLVPTDTHGEAGGNILHLAGFKHDAAKESLHEAIAGAKGETAGHALGLHLPWITIGFAAYRNYQAIQLGKDPRVAAKHAVLESIGRGTGVVVGAKAGGLVGTLGGPLGMVIGAISGGIVGALFGGALAEDFKQRPLRRAQADLDAALQMFGSSFAGKITHIQQIAGEPLARMRSSMAALVVQLQGRYGTLRWWFWPDYYGVLLEETVAIGRERLELEQHLLANLNAILQAAKRSGRFEALGVIMVNTPALRAQVGFDTQQLDRVSEARGVVLYERKQLNPAVALPS